MDEVFQLAMKLPDEDRLRLEALCSPTASIGPSTRRSPTS